MILGMFWELRICNDTITMTVNEIFSFFYFPFVIVNNLIIKWWFWNIIRYSYFTFSQFISFSRQKYRKTHKQKYRQITIIFLLFNFYFHFLLFAAYVYFFFIFIFLQFVRMTESIWYDIVWYDNTNIEW